MRTNRNKNLFWYGFKAKIKEGFGKLGIVFGCAVGLISLALGSYTGMFVVFLLFGLGIWGFFSGQSQRFDYKLQSGSMIHRGDW